MRSDDVHLFFIATAGQGEYPTTSQAFFDELDRHAGRTERQAKDRQKFRFALFGLGNTAYEEFNYA